MDTEIRPNFESTPEVLPDPTAATLLTAHVLGEAPSEPAATVPTVPPSTSPSGWALVMAAVAIALAVLLLLGIALGVGYVLDVRNGVDSFGVQSNSGSCTTSS